MKHTAGLRNVMTPYKTPESAAYEEIMKMLMEVDGVLSSTLALRAAAIWNKRKEASEETNNQ